MNSIKKAITMIISLAMLAPLTSCSSGKKSGKAAFVKGRIYREKA